MADIHPPDEPRVKKVRKEGKLTFLSNLKEGEKFQMYFYMGHPCKDSATKLSHYVGYIAKDGNVLPLSIFNWKRMPRENIERAMQEIKHMFKFPDDVDVDSIDSILYSKLNDKWKKHKNKMKTKGFDPNKTKEENLANRPSGVLESQWGPLVEMWGQEENQGRMVEYHNQASQPGSGIVLSRRKDAVSYVMGDDTRGRVRCLGNTVKPKDFWGEEPKTSKAARLQIENDNLKRQLAEKDKRILELETQVGTMQSVWNGYVNYAGTRPELPPNSNNPRLVNGFVNYAGTRPELPPNSNSNGLVNGFVNYAGTRPELQPNLNSNGLLDLLIDVEGNYSRQLVEASNDVRESVSSDSEASDDNQQPN